MKIPTELIIGAFKWTVSIGDQPFHDANNSYGHTSSRHLQIKIEENIPKQKQTEALLHEVIHACLWNSGIAERLDRFDRELDEDITTSLARQLYQVLKDNKLYFDE